MPTSCGHYVAIWLLLPWCCHNDVAMMLPCSHFSYLLWCSHVIMHKQEIGGGVCKLRALKCVLLVDFCLVGYVEMYFSAEKRANYECVMPDAQDLQCLWQALFLSHAYRWYTCVFLAAYLYTVDVSQKPSPMMAYQGNTQHFTLSIMYGVGECFLLYLHILKCRCVALWCHSIHLYSHSLSCLEIQGQYIMHYIRMYTVTYIVCPSREPDKWSHKRGGLSSRGCVRGGGNHCTYSVNISTKSSTAF